MKKQFFYLYIFIITFSSCTNQEEKIKLPSPAESSIDISKVSFSLPESKGVDLVNSNCATCHSLRYIEMQPNMNHKGWDKIVKKMVKNYGAPISDTTVINQIVDYLTTIKGKK